MSTKKPSAGCSLNSAISRFTKAGTASRVGCIGRRLNFARDIGARSLGGGFLNNLGENITLLVILALLHSRLTRHLHGATPWVRGVANGLLFAAIAIVGMLVPIHLAKGIGCSTCHGRVDVMPLTWRVVSLDMQWCLDCHRDPAPHLRPREQITNMSWQPDSKTARSEGERLARAYDVHTRTSCTTCHR